ncbi:SHC-transforming protein 3 [Trichosurus vulpecula]|uniref:SHC-transforming protein 3 n=1 Tax=Trichosurus vulpecula TaxID=9337 RepID=UPI00186B1678|nr:SHC-transforming protein 3 [Trichosurus vulpecula]
MRQHTKYNRFRNDSVTSVDELIHNLSTNTSKVSTIATTSAISSSYVVSTKVLHKDQEDGPTTLCTLKHKVSHLKFSSSSNLLGIKNLPSAVKDLAVSKLPGSLSVPSSASGASDNTCNLVSATLCSQQNTSNMSTGKKFQPEEMQLGGEVCNSNSIFVNKPSGGWLHSNEKILGPGVTFEVKYLGCLEVLRSMRSLDFGTRTQITREAISRVCDAVPGAKGGFRKQKPPRKVLSNILGKSNLQFAGMSITLNISTTSLNLMTPDSKQIIANHHMQSISFASGGDPDTTDYVAYVAKDPVNHRACHILECSDGLARDVISTIGQAFELRFKQYLQCPSKIPALHDCRQSLDEPWMEEEGERAEHPYYNSIPNKVPQTAEFLDVRSKTRVCTVDTSKTAGREQTYYQGRHLGGKFSDDWHHAPIHQGSLDSYNMPEGKSQVTPPGEAPIYVNTQRVNIQVLQALQGDAESVFSESVDTTKDNSPRKDLFDMRPFEDALKNQTMEPLLNKAMSVENTSPILSRAADWRMMEELKAEPWYQGEMSRKEAEQLLKKDGDFLVRKSTTNPGSYVLTGIHNGQVKHLLLVDPEGTVRTKDQVFDSISHLINHHLENNLPIISAGSELCLQQPVQRKQ